jgi:LDH2 family malate/lactate/ureidoglycolate dehydrogenase
MPTIQHTILRPFGYALFQAAGLPEDQAKIAMDHLVDANLTGHDSHGILRIPAYALEVHSGSIQPAGNHKIVRETPASLTIDANKSFGIVLCNQAMQWAVDRARQHTFGAVAVHHTGHIGRLGDFPPLAAEQGCLGLLMLNGGSRWVAPFGGAGRRLPPNPIAFSAPGPDGLTITVDMTTSVVAGGKILVLNARGQHVPEGWLVDEQGKPASDPQVWLDGEAAVLPLGGLLFGHKGYGLAMMVDAIAGGLSWAGCSAEEPTRGGSGYIAMAIKIESFIDLEDYKREIGILIDWVKSSPKMPGVDKIYYPGEIEDETRRQREVEGIYVEDATWNDILEVASELGVSPPQGMGS